MPVRISRAGRARRSNEQGMSFSDAGRDAEALQAYREAARLDPEWTAPWYNIGLLHKYRGEWAEALAANREALARDPRHEGATWNLGIAATALADWPAARQAWRSYGIAVPEGHGPVDYFIGLTPIRVANEGHPEVVWADRIDPARAVIRSVPTPQSGRRYGDLVLHDGAPNGYRLLEGREVPVFDEIQVLAPSAHATFDLEVQGVAEDGVAALKAIAEPADVHVENWTTGLRQLCKACSEGRPFAEGGHDHDAPAANDGAFRLGIAARTELEVRRLLQAWRQAHPAAAVGALTCLLPAGEGSP